MKKTAFIVIALTLVSYMGFAENTAEPAKESNKRSHRRHHGRMAEQWKKMMVERYDADGDGEISEEEKAEAEKAWEAKKAEWKKTWEAKKAEWVEKYDTDGDGELSREERKAGWKDAHAKRNAEMLEKYDADGDGELSDSEKTQLRTDMKKRWEDWWKKEFPEKEKVNTVRIP